MYCRNHYIPRNSCGVSERYLLGPKRLGAGGRAYVVEGTCLSTGASRAIKVASKAKAAQDFGGPLFEGNVMAKLDHPNILKLYEIFLDEENVYLVLELCAGGGLLSCTQRWGQVLETDVRVLMVQILRAVRYMNKCRIRHGDLVIDNILMVNHEPPERNTVKVADFGGLRKGQQAVDDIFSCGSLMQTLLSMGPPALANSNKRLLRRSDSLHAYPPPVFNEDGIECHVSKNARDLLFKLKNGNGSGHKRLTAGQALGHKWLRRCAPYYSIKKGALPAELSERIRRFPNRSPLQQAALIILADRLDGEPAQTARQLFASVDFYQDGFVSPYDLRKATTRAGLPPLRYAAETLRNVDLDGLGVVDFTVFIAMCLDVQTCMTDNACREVFAFFDRLQTGEVSIEQLRLTLSKGQLANDNLIADKIADALRDLGGGVDGMVGLAEFSNALRAEAAADRSSAPEEVLRGKASDPPVLLQQNADRDIMKAVKVDLIVKEDRRCHREAAKRVKREAARAVRAAKVAKKRQAAALKQSEEAARSPAKAITGESKACWAEFDGMDGALEAEVDSSGSGSDFIFSDVDGEGGHDLYECEWSRERDQPGSSSGSKSGSPLPLASHLFCERVVVHL